MEFQEIEHAKDNLSFESKAQHVFSGEIASGIFHDLVDYFMRYRPSGWVVEAADHPTAADIYHYHRPQLEAELRRPCVVTVHHDLDETDHYVSFDKFEPRYREANSIICLNTLQQAALRKIGFENAVVIPHGYNSRVISGVQMKRVVRAQQKFVLGLASRRYGRRVKGEALLYEYAKRLPTDKFSFLLVGADRSIDGIMLSELGFDVKAFEYMPYNLFGEVYKAMDALLVLSWHEGGPACVPEAVASATPIFAVEVGMTVDYVDHLENGIILQREIENDVESIVKVVENKHGELEKIVEGAFSRRRRVPEWQEVVQSHFDLYRGIVDG